MTARHTTIVFGFVALVLANPPAAVKSEAGEIGTGEVEKKRTVTFEPAERENELAPELQLERRTFTAVEEPVGRRLLRVRFPSAVVSDHAPNNVVHAELFLPDGDRHGASRRPAVVFLHYLDGDLALPRVFCRSLAVGGVAALLVKMPYYHERRDGTAQRMVSLDPERTAAAVRQAALDVRYARSYLASRPDVEPDRIGIAGISLGGIVGSLAFQAEPRLDRGCFFLAGADLPTLLWESALTKKFRGQWEQAGVTREAIQAAFASVDPATYPGRTGGRPVLLLCGKGDAVMPAVCTQSLIAALADENKSPDVVWYDGGHKPSPADVADSLLRLVAFYATFE